MKRPRSLEPARMTTYLLQGVGCAALASGVVLVATSGEATWQHLREFPAWLLPVITGMIALSWISNSARIWLMCRATDHPIRYRQALAVTLSTEFGINATPAGVGGSVIRLSLLHRARVPLGTGGGLLAADMLIDTLFFALLTPFAIFLLLRDGVLGALLERPSNGDALLSLLALALIGIGAVALIRSPRFQRAVTRAVGATAVGRRHRLAPRLRHARHTLPNGLRRARATLVRLWQQRKTALLLNFGLAAVQHCCRYLTLPVIIWSFGIGVDALPLVLVQGVLFAISLLVVAPGGGGSVELLSALILPGLVPAGLVGIVVLVWRFFTYHVYVICGASVFFYVTRRFTTLFPVADAEMPRFPAESPATGG